VGGKKENGGEFQQKTAYQAFSKPTQLLALESSAFLWYQNNITLYQASLRELSRIWLSQTYVAVPYWNRGHRLLGFGVLLFALIRIVQAFFGTTISQDKLRIDNRMGILLLSIFCGQPTRGSMTRHSAHCPFLSFYVDVRFTGWKSEARSRCNGAAHT